jgi:redox-sensitive bicupin YhaK (pirin superfamily)
VVVEEGGRAAHVTIIAGSFRGVAPPRPPPRSWAARPDSQVAIWSIKLDPGMALDLPAAPAGVNRTLYFFAGASLDVGGQVIGARTGARVRPEVPLALFNGPAASEVLVLQGRPIGEPVVQHGPFVMNSAGEIQAAFDDYQATRFGGWPWPSDDPVFPREEGRFARHADGRVERRG